MKSKPRNSVLEHRFLFDGLMIEASGRVDDGVLDSFFPAYEAAFVLPNEKEEIAGFRECLALNAGPAHDGLVARHGDFQEVVLVAREGADGAVLGGANFLLLRDLCQQPGLPQQPSLNLNYLFVDRGKRGRGLSRRLLRACHAIADDWTGTATGATLCFLEVNDPFRLTPTQYNQDSAHAGIDQLARLAYWAHLDCAVLDWPYVQPALSAGQTDDDTLAFALLGARWRALPVEIVLHHIERFFAISVLKGTTLSDSPSAQRQINALRRRAQAGGSIRLLALAPALADLPRSMGRRGQARPPSLADALRGTW